MLNFDSKGQGDKRGHFGDIFILSPGHVGDIPWWLYILKIYIPQNVPHDIAPGGTIKSATFPTWHPDGGQNPRRPVKALLEVVFLQEGKVPNEGTGKVKRKDFYKRENSFI